MSYGVGSVSFTRVRSAVTAIAVRLVPSHCQIGTSYRGFGRKSSFQFFCTMHSSAAFLVALAIGADALAPANVLSRRGMAQAAGAGMASLLATEPAFAKGKAAMPPPAPAKASKKASKKDSKAAAAPSGVDLIKTLFVRAAASVIHRAEQ